MSGYLYQYMTDEFARFEALAEEDIGDSSLGYDMDELVYCRPRGSSGMDSQSQDEEDEETPEDPKDFFTRMFYTKDYAVGAEEEDEMTFFKYDFEDRDAKTWQVQMPDENGQCAAIQIHRDPYKPSLELTASDMEELWDKIQEADAEQDAQDWQEEDTLSLRSLLDDLPEYTTESGMDELD